MCKAATLLAFIEHRCDREGEEEKEEWKKKRGGGGWGVKQGNLAAFVKVMEFPDRSLAER